MFPDFSMFCEKLTLFEWKRHGKHHSRLKEENDISVFNNWKNINRDFCHGTRVFPFSNLWNFNISIRIFCLARRRIQAPIMIELTPKTLFEVSCGVCLHSLYFCGFEIGCNYYKVYNALFRTNQFLWTIESTSADEACRELLDNYKT